MGWGKNYPQVQQLEPGKTFSVDFDLMRLTSGPLLLPGEFQVRGIYRSAELKGNHPAKKELTNLWIGEAATEPVKFTLKPRADMTPKPNPVVTSDETLSACLRHAELVAVGAVVSKPTVTATGTKSAVRREEFDFKIAEMLKGKAPGEAVIPVTLDRQVGANERPGPKQGERLVLFLNPLTKWLGTRKPWLAAQVGSDVQPGSSEMIARVKRLVATTPPPVPGAVQLVTLVNKYLPGYKVHATGNTLTTPDGKEINLAAARGEWRGHIITLDPKDEGRQLHLRGGHLWRNRTLSGLVLSLNLKVESAAAAEDVSRIIQGLFHGPNLLDTWTVKAEPMEGGWRVTPTYDGPPAQVMEQHPMELIVEERVLKDVREDDRQFHYLVSGPHPADNVAGPGWGEAVRGLSVRLQADKPVLYLADGPVFRLSLRNLGSEPLAVPESQELGSLEMDGVWYRFAGPHSQLYHVASKRLGPGEQMDNIAVVPLGDWSKDGKAIRPVAGKHRFRFAISAKRLEPNSGPALRAVSNSVEVEFRWGVAPPPSSPPATNAQPTSKQPEIRAEDVVPAKLSVESKPVEKDGVSVSVSLKPQTILADEQPQFVVRFKNTNRDYINLYNVDHYWDWEILFTKTDPHAAEPGPWRLRMNSIPNRRPVGIRQIKAGESTDVVVNLNDPPFTFDFVYAGIIKHLIAPVRYLQPGTYRMTVKIALPLFMGQPFPHHWTGPVLTDAVELTVSEKRANGTPATAAELAAYDDAIDRVIKKLDPSGRLGRFGLWTNGGTPFVKLAAGAKAEDVIAAAVNVYLLESKAYRILRVRQVGSDDLAVSAALVKVGGKPKVLVFFSGKGSTSWWTRFYDADVVQPAAPAKEPDPNPTKPDLSSQHPLFQGLMKVGSW